MLLSIGKENLYVWEKKPGILHEDRSCCPALQGRCRSEYPRHEPREGKIELIADCDGLLKIDRRALLAVNSTPQMMIATIHGDLPVKKGAKLAIASSRWSLSRRRWKPCRLLPGRSPS